MERTGYKQLNVKEFNKNRQNAKGTSIQSGEVENCNLEQKTAYSLFAFFAFLGTRASQ